MKDDKQQDQPVTQIPSEHEDLNIILDQLDQIMEVMGSTVERMRTQLQRKQQKAANQRDLSSSGKNATYVLDSESPSVLH